MKTSPHNAEAEQALLGALFIRPAITRQVEAVLDPDDFGAEKHQHIAKAFFSLKERADPVTVSQWLLEHGQKVPSGYVESLADCVPTSAGWSHHAEIVKGLSERRKVIKACQEAIDGAHDLMEDLQTTLSEHKSRIKYIGTDRAPSYKSNRDLVNSIVRDMEDRGKSGNHYVGIKTGLANIDDQCHGLEPKTTGYIIARPSVGKTALGLNIAENVAAHYAGKVIFFSLESGEQALTRRRLAIHSNVFVSKIRTGDIPPESPHWDALIKAANTISESNLTILTHPKFKTVEILTTRAESMAMDGPISLVLVDHIQRMRAKRRTQNRHLELSYISEELTSLAHNLKAPILILCQLRRDVDHRRNPRPMLSDMKESGDLEANADQVWGLYRKNPEAEFAELQCLKGRDTGTWRAWLKFDRFTQRFYDSEPEYERPIERDADSL